MEISLAEEHAYYFVPQISMDIARDRIEKKKATLVAGMFGSLISRPNPNEIQVISVENRLEPYWVITAASRTTYDRQQVYTIPIKGEEVREALKEPVGHIVDAVLRSLEQVEPELAADLVDNGIHLAGGGALLRGFDQVLAKATGLDVKVVDDPLTCVARGTSEYLDYLDDWHTTLESDEDEY